MVTVVKSNFRDNISKLSDIWVVSELYYPEETSTGYFLTRIAEGLAALYKVGVLCSQPTYSSKGQISPVNEVRNRVTIYRCWSTTFNKDALPLRVVNVVTIALSVFLNALRRFRKDNIIIVVTNPPLLPFVVLLASIFRRTKYCLIIHDVYPEVLSAVGIVKPNSFIFCLIDWLTYQIYKRAVCTVVLGRDMAKLVKKKLCFNDNSLLIIPNWADVDFIRPREREAHPFLKKLGISEKFVIQFSGNIGRTHGIDHLICCAEKFSRDSTTHFLFIGFGGKKNWLKHQVEKKALSNVTIMDYRPREKLPLSLTACDIAIISFVHGMSGVSVPSRMYNIMAAGKPIIAIADSKSELSRVVAEENIGWVVSPGDVKALSEAIFEAKANQGKLAEMGQRSRQCAKKKYCYERVLKDYIDLINNIRDH